EVEKRLAKIEAATCCPTCGADGETWKDQLLKTTNDALTELRNKNKSEPESYNRELDELEEERKTALEEIAIKVQENTALHESKKAELEQIAAQLERVSLVVNKCSQHQQELNNAQARVNRLNQDRQK